MKPLIPILGYLTFLISLFGHIFHWRLHRPKRDVIALSINFIFLPAIFIFLLIPVYIKLSFIESFSIYLLHFGLSGCYIAVYPAVQAISPTLKILLLFRTLNSIELTPNEIAVNFEKSNLVSERIQDLVDSNLVIKKDRKILITDRGRLIVLFYGKFRNILGLSFKGG